MNDPLDHVPEDHGSDRYGYVELINAPLNVSPSPALVEQELAACLDCNVNVFFTWRPDLKASWSVQIAHDEGCPMYAKLEAEGKLVDP